MELGKIGETVLINGRDKPHLESWNGVVGTIIALNGNLALIEDRIIGGVTMAMWCSPDEYEIQRS